MILRLHVRRLLWLDTLELKVLTSLYLPCDQTVSFFPGDFAVLLKAGMTVRQAILYNVLSAMMGYLGMVTGIVIGHYAENICMWIFALTAGLFLYVALVDMVSHASDRQPITAL